MPLNKIKKILGKPYYQSGECLIYNLDCVTAMQLLPDEFIPLTITSPPYNIGKEYEESLPLDVFLEWCKRWITEVHRINANQ